MKFCHVGNKTYSHPDRHQALETANGLEHLLDPTINFEIGDIREREVIEFIKKVRSKCVPGCVASRIIHAIYNIIYASIANIYVILSLFSFGNCGAKGFDRGLV